MGSAKEDSTKPIVMNIANSYAAVLLVPELCIASCYKGWQWGKNVKKYQKECPPNSGTKQIMHIQKILGAW
jgi:hypothetical protein